MMYADMNAKSVEMNAKSVEMNAIPKRCDFNRPIYKLLDWIDENLYF